MPMIAGASALKCVGLFSAALLMMEEEEQENRLLAVASAVVPETLLSLRKRHSGRHENFRRVKRKLVFWNRERANACTMEDYLGPVPAFSLDDFQRIFRISQTIYDDLRNRLCTNDPFFRDGFDAAKRKKISTDAKILMALKCLAYGTCVNAFRDYFQLGESSARLCVLHFTFGVYQDEYLRSFYLCSMSSADAKRVEAMHYEQHGVHGMVGSLYCSHIPWNNCPVAYQGQFKGKEEKPTIIMEALCDYQLFAWHFVVGYAGTLNDINVWDNSLLHKAFIDGSFSHLDFPFKISGEEFHELWCAN
jgi:hypothetical protein